ncbi:MAG: hypothetical protein GTN99_08140 [Candidatus Dadabacteria bacterium]|nr:hypothetical protein [Candidatus Dadabacteria bacterium]
MSATNAFETEILQLIFENADFVGIGDAGGLRGSVAAGVFYISLHTATLDDTTADQSVSETTYTSYARQSVARSTAGWTVTGNTVDNDAAITFPTGTGGSGTVTDFGIGDGASGATALHFYGALTSSLVVGNGVQPEFAIGALNITAD